jgi:subtilisin family serine protease
VRVRLRAGAAHGRLSLWARGADAHHVTPGAFADPASGPTPLVVGAVRAVGYAGNGAESFSSWGPTHGGLARPDVAGPDGLSSTVYGGTGFYGTSAATPAVAAAAALLLGDDPSLGPLGAAERLRAEIVSGTRADEPSRAARLGAGRIRLGPPGDPLPRPCGGEGGAACVVAPWVLGALRRRGRRGP